MTSAAAWRWINRERRLKCIDMANALSPFEQSYAEVRDPARAHLALPDQRATSHPRESSTGVPIASGQVELVQVDALDTEPAK